MKLNLASVVALLCVCAVICGCSKGPKKPADLPNLNPTTIVVTYDDGTPVEAAQVALRVDPKKSTGGRTWNLTGLTDATGTLILKTDGNWDGAPAGTYQVMVTKLDTVVDQPNEPGAGATIKSITRRVNQKYEDPNNSGLSATIEDGKSNTIELKVGEPVEEDVKVVN